MRSYPRTAFVNQFNFKNATVFFTNAFKRKAALNKWSLFSYFVLVTSGVAVSKNVKWGRDVMNDFGILVRVMIY